MKGDENIDKQCDLMLRKHTPDIISFGEDPISACDRIGKTHAITWAGQC